MANGAKLPDISVSQQTSDPDIEIEIRPTQNAETKKYIWQYVSGEADVRPGPLPKDATKVADRVAYFAHYPGKWECQVVHKDKVVRNLAFSVSKDGYVEADPAQTGLRSPSDVVPIALSFGKDILDVRVRPAVMTKSRGWGLPWPKPPTTKFPPASGLPDPK
jgi:hypothetical protein